MRKLLTIALLFVCFVSNAQTKLKSVTAINGKKYIVNHPASFLIEDSLSTIDKLMSQCDQTTDAGKRRYTAFQNTVDRLNVKLVEIKNRERQDDLEEPEASTANVSISPEVPIEQPNTDRGDSIKEVLIKYYSDEKHIEGHGKCSYANSLRYAESMLATKHSLQDFENTLCKWERRTFDSRIVMEYNKKTAQFDKPRVDLQYSSMPNTFDFDIVDVQFHSEKRIESIGFEMHEYKVEDNIIPQLKALGFKYNKVTSRLLNTLENTDRNTEFRNETKKLGVSIRYLGEKQYYVEMYSLN